MVDLNKNSKTVLIAVIICLLTIAIITFGFISGKFSSIKPKEPLPDSKAVMAQFANVSDIIIDEQSEFHKEKQELERKARSKKKKESIDNNKNDSKRDFQYIQYRAPRDVYIEELALDYGVSIVSIAKANNVKNDHLFFERDIILIPKTKDATNERDG